MIHFSRFSVIDWIVIVFTLLFSLAIGIYYAVRHNKSNQDLLLGGRNLKVLPVAASIMATYVSAITVLGLPAEVYSFGGEIVMINVVSGCAFIISAYIFVPFFYEMKLTSVNQYLEDRFDSKTVRRLASFTFILQQLLLTAVALYAPSLVLESFLGFPTWLSIIGVGLCGTVYTSIGGLRAVVWTDLFQAAILILGMIAIVFKGFSSVGGFSSAMNIAYEGGRLNFIDTTFDPFMRHNLWNFLIGTTFYTIMQPAVHQHQVQRYSSMSSVTKARRVVICSVPLKLTIIFLCLLTGVSVYAMYSKCDPFLQGKINKVDQIVPYFVVHELADMPGMIGLFTACIFSGVLSTVSSALNSMSAVTWEDFLKDLKLFEKLSENGQANVSRLVGFLYGIVIIGLAFASQNIGAIYSASYAAVGATGGALYGVFLLGMIFPFVTSKGAILGLITGLSTMTYVSTMAFYHKKGGSVRLPTSIEDCSNSTESHSLNSYSTNSAEDLTGFDKIYQLSYLLYAIVASFITIVIGIVFSLIENLVARMNGNEEKVRKPENLFHPFVRRLINFEKADKVSVVT